MKNWKRYAWYSFVVFQIMVFLLVAEKPANAYVDPGSGLLFLQVAGSMVAGAVFVLRQKIRKLLGLGSPAQTAEATDDDVDDAGGEPRA